jgi:hypothetical protein
MDGLNPSSAQVSPQITERPTVITVFGILNIAFGCYQLICTSPGLYKITVSTLKGFWKIAASDLSLFLLLSFVGIGFSIWLIALGIGLLRMKRWSRRGSVMYARIIILLTAITLGIPFISMSIGWSSVPKEMWGRFVFDMLIGLIQNLTYPILLLIFMKSAKVKQAFGE